VLRRFLILVILAFALPARAQIAIDGTYVGDEADYGPAKSVQNTNTGYGNATTGDPKVVTSGSEIDQVFATVKDGRLNVLITGNLETGNSFNKFSVFIDSTSGGMNQINGGQSPSMVDPYCCGGSVGALQRLNGLRFDTGFAADHFLAFSNGNHEFGNPLNQLDIWTLTSYYADLTSGPTGNKSEIGFQRNAHGIEPGLAVGEPIDQLNNGCTGPSDTACNPLEHEFAEPVDTVNDPTNSRGHRDFLNDVGLLMAINNSNTGGVNAGSGAATGNPGSVLTGIEFSVPLAVLGNLASEIKIAAFIGNGGYTHISNQFAGIGVLQANLGSPSSVNLANVAGNQFVSVAVPSGDFDGDGNIDGRDFLTWQRNNGSAADLAIWQEQYGSSGPLSAATSIPEPSTATVLFLLIAAGGSLRWNVIPAQARI
jgi:hypothetical protein